MPRVSAKQLQRRIATLNMRYTLAQPKRSGRFFRRILIILAIIAVAAFSYAHRTTSDFVQLTLKQGPTTTKRQLSCRSSGEMECHVGSSLNRIQTRRVTA